MYVPNDPRETLVTKGNALLEALYRRHVWEKTYPDLSKSIDKGADNTPGEIEAITSTPDFLTAVIERMGIDSELSKVSSDYLTIRETIEAMSTPRADITSEEV